MKKSLFTSCLVGILAIAPVTRAENLDDLSQLLSTRTCNNCELTGTGLVNAKLGRAVMRGTDFRQANLSRADLSLSDLRGADLRGASLSGANLAGANLEGAMLDGADLRGAYLSGANFTNTSLNTFYIHRAIGLLEAPVSAERLYQWGFIEGESNNYRMAIAYYNAAIQQQPSNGAIYLSRAVASLRLKDYAAARQDATSAQMLFEGQGSTVGVDASQKLMEEIEITQNPDTNSNTFGSVLGSVTSLLLRLLF
ncbi:MAG: pentapeptide repeat-containing protein [Limnothrix sp.]